MTCGERVKKVRKSRNLTLEKFGEKLGVTKVAISNIENGNRSLTDQMAKSICREFGISYKWLTTEEGDMLEPKDMETELTEWASTAFSGDSASFKKRFVNMMMRLTDHEWELLEKKLLELADGEEIARAQISDEPTVEELEAEYKKSRSKAARRTEPSASSTTGDGDMDAAANE